MTATLFTQHPELARKLESIGQLDAFDIFRPNESVANAPCWLNQLGVINITGADSEKFLQGQLTCDVLQCTEQQALLGACCNAKGRTLANFILLRQGQDYLMILPFDNIAPLLKHLAKYSVFFKSQMSDISAEQLVIGRCQADQEQPLTGISSPFIFDAQQLALNSDLTLQLVNRSDFEQMTLAQSDNWLMRAMQQGLLLLTSSLADQYVPQHIDMHRLTGISFDKGCYTGQEIIARLQYLGKNKDDSKKKHLIFLTAHVSLKQSQALLDAFTQQGLNLALPELAEKKVAQLVQLHYAADQQQLSALAVCQQALTDGQPLDCINSVAQSFTLQKLTYTN